MDPTIGGYQDFIYNIMSVPVDSLPTASPVITFTYNLSLDIVLSALQCIPMSSPTLSIYAVAVYNYAADALINFAPDIPSAADPTYWADLRQQFGCNSFVGGVVNFSSDQSTSTGFAVSDGLKNLMIGDLQNLKTPYGRMYLSIAQSAGVGPWGIS